MPVNGQKIIVPCNTVLQMPALALTWGDLFSLAPADLKLGSAAQTALALQDTVSAINSPALSPGYNGPLPSYEITAQGTIVEGRCIAGLVFVSQQSINLGQGVINFIDYAKGELHVGGAPVANLPQEATSRLKVEGFVTDPA